MQRLRTGEITRKANIARMAEELEKLKQEDAVSSIKIETHVRELDQLQIARHGISDALEKAKLVLGTSGQDFKALEAGFWGFGA